MSHQIIKFRNCKNQRTIQHHTSLALPCFRRTRLRGISFSTTHYFQGTRKGTSTAKGLSNDLDGSENDGEVISQFNMICLVVEMYYIIVFSDVNYNSFSVEMLTYNLLC